MKRIRFFLLIFALSFLAVFVARAWIEPTNTTPLGGVEAPLVANSAHQAKSGTVDVADVWVKSFGNWNDETQNFQNRGEWLSRIFNQPGIYNLIPSVHINYSTNSDVAEVRCGMGRSGLPEILLTCFGARDAQMVVNSNDPCGNENTCGILGTEPFDANGNPPTHPAFQAPAIGCRTRLQFRTSNLEPVAIAYCVDKVPRR